MCVLSQVPGDWVGSLLLSLVFQALWEDEEQSADEVKGILFLCESRVLGVLGRQCLVLGFSRPRPMVVSQAGSDAGAGASHVVQHEPGLGAFSLAGEGPATQSLVPTASRAASLVPGGLPP